MNVKVHSAEVVSKRELAVVLAADNNFSIPFGIAVLSLLKTASSTTRYDIYVLDDKINSDVKIKVEELKSEFDFNITYFDVTEVVKQVPESYLFPKVAFARFLIPQLIPDSVHGLVLYSDSDVLFREDLTALFDTDLNGLPVGACPDTNLAIKYQRSYVDVLEQEYGVKFYSNGELYYHSGLLLFDCKAWKEGKYTEKIFDLCKKGLSDKILYFDQDMLNVVCHGKIKRLSSRYCSVPLFEDAYCRNYDEKYSDIVDSFETKEGMISAYSHPAIIHYAGVKPMVFREPRFLNEKPFYNEWLQSPWKNSLPYFPRELVLIKQPKERIQLLTAEKIEQNEKIVSVVLYVDEEYDNSAIDGIVRSICSIMNQSWPYIEILVIDNNANELLCDFFNKCEELKLIRHIRCSLSRSSALQHAAYNARGKFLHYIECGTELLDVAYYSMIVEKSLNMQFVPDVVRKDILCETLKSFDGPNDERFLLSYVSSMISRQSFTDEVNRNDNDMVKELEVLRQKHRELLLLLFYKKILLRYYRARFLKLFKFGKRRAHYKEQVRRYRRLVKQIQEARENNSIRSLMF